MCSLPASCDVQGHALRQGLRLKKPSAPAAPFVGVFELGGASAQVMQIQVPTCESDHGIVSVPRRHGVLLCMLMARCLLTNVMLKTSSSVLVLYSLYVHVTASADVSKMHGLTGQI